MAWHGMAWHGTAWYAWYDMTWGRLPSLQGARRVIELGVFTGVATLGIALALPADGVLVASDIQRDYTLARRRPTS